jgi:hypothetical protein
MAFVEAGVVLDGPDPVKTLLLDPYGILSHVTLL